MRFIKIFILLLVLAVAEFAAPVLVQQAIVTADSDENLCVLGSNPSTGNTIILLVSYLSTNTINLPSSANDSPYTKAVTSTGSGIAVDIWYFHNITGGANSKSVIVPANFATRVSVNCSEWSGLTNAVPSATNTNTGLLSTTVTTNSITPVTAANLVITIGGWTANQYSSGPINSFTRMTQTGGGSAYQEGAYIIQATATSNSTGWTLGLGINWAAAIATFSAPASGPTNAQRGAGFFMPPNEDFDLLNVLHK